jgi:hypothetical protein
MAVGGPRLIFGLGFIEWMSLLRHYSFLVMIYITTTAVANEYKLDKTETSFADLLNAFHLSLTLTRLS